MSYKLDNEVELITSPTGEARTAMVPLMHMVGMFDHYFRTLGVVGPKEAIYSMLIPVVADEEHNVEITLDIIKNEQSTEVLN